MKTPADITASALTTLSSTFSQLLAELEILGADERLIKEARHNQECALLLALQAKDKLDGQSKRDSGLA